MHRAQGGVRGVNNELDAYGKKLDVKIDLRERAGSATAPGARRAGGAG